jgi:cytosine deaminase
MVVPGLIDFHTHLDKGHIWPRQPNLTGDSSAPRSLRARTRPVGRRRTFARMDFELATAHAHGVVAARSTPPRPIIVDSTI